MKFDGQNIILIYLTTLANYKKLSRDSLEDKNFNICPAHRPPICPVPETVLQSNIVQSKLFCQICYFLADQTYT
jgi:hypothetical protein